jgi:hypothetical protein
MTAAARATAHARNGAASPSAVAGGSIRNENAGAAGYEQPFPGDPDSPRSPWECELATALQDVQAAIANNGSAAREPMFIPAAELFTREYPATSWLVNGLITRGGIVTIGAEPKASKTWLATEIALAISSGAKVCGEFFAERGKVAYFFAEDRRWPDDEDGTIAKLIWYTASRARVPRATVRTALQDGVPIANG